MADKQTPRTDEHYAMLLRREAPRNSRIGQELPQPPDRWSYEAILDFKDFTGTLELELLSARQEIAELRSALERTANALRLAYSKQPLRDMAETLAEADHALKGK